MAKVKSSAVWGSSRAADFFWRMALIEIKAFIKALSILCFQRIKHMCPLGGGGGDHKGAKGTNNPRGDRYILRPSGALAMGGSHVPPWGRRGRPIGSEGDK